MSDSIQSPLHVEFDTQIYRVSAIKKAAYRFGDRCHIQIEFGKGGKIVVTLKPKGPLNNLQRLAGDFENEVLDQELREVVGQETEGVRNLLLAQAYAQTSLLDPQGEQADYHDDPLHIRASDRQRSASTEQE